MRLKIYRYLEDLFANISFWFELRADAIDPDLQIVVGISASAVDELFHRFWDNEEDSFYDVL